MSDAERVETAEVSFSLSGERLTLRDEAGGGEVVVELDGDTSLTRATTSWFNVPMDGAVSFEAERLRFPNVAGATLKEADGSSYDIISDQWTTASGSTFVDVSASMKVVAYVEEGPTRASVSHSFEEATVIEFDEPTRVVLGARSFHKEPTTTITVPDDTGALMRAVSHLGSSIKEWSPERSWPTLRGHPPEIEIGDKLDIPNRLAVPNTEVTVSVPQTIADVLRVAPLAYYFGAEVVPGDRAELRLGEQHVERLGSGRELEQYVDELLARGLVLDSLARVGGYYSLHRHEYDQLAPELTFYPPELYDEPIHRQLMEYLEVPFSTLKPHVPRWSSTLTLRPEIEDAAALPYSLAVLSRVRVTPDGHPRPSEENGEPLLSTASMILTDTAFVPAAGRSVAMGSRRRLPEDARVLLVGGEPLDGDCFARTEWSNYDIDRGVPAPQQRHTLTQAELADALAASPLYLHFAGEVTPEGFVCSDGVLAFDALPDADVGALSFTWKDTETAPLETLFDVVTVGCLPTTPFPTPVAEAFAKYLMLGFSPWQAARFVGWENHVRYLGDASLSLVDNVNGNPPGLLTLERTPDDQYRLEELEWSIKRDWLGVVAQAIPEPAESGFVMIGGTMEKRRRFSLDDVRELAAGDHLLRFHGDVPDEVPTESVIHTSREGWGTDGDTATSPDSEPPGQPFSDT